MTTSASLLERLDATVAQHNREGAGLYRAIPTREAAQIYVQQWGLFTRHSRRCWAWVVGNCPVVEVRRFITRENLYEEEGADETSHYEILARLGVKLGLPRAAIDAAEALPTTRLALLVWETLTKNRSWAEGLAAKAVLERVGFPDLRRLRRDNWKRALGLSDADLGFFTTHIEADEIHGSGAYDLLARYVPPAEHDAAVAAAQASIEAMMLHSNGIAAAMQARGAILPSE
ncbi:MAG TPA: iron-containing redox enzyme family protein [Chloroflexota bacterium]|nr:iron-containing redox enzyme family protein [Chloroflexota bacterium]